MEKERRRSNQDEVHVGEGPNGPVKGINSRAEVEGAGKGGGPWRLVMTVLGQSSEMQTRGRGMSLRQM